MPTLFAMSLATHLVWLHRWYVTISKRIDLEHSNPIFLQDTPAYDDVPSN